MDASGENGGPDSQLRTAGNSDNLADRGLYVRNIKASMIYFRPESTVLAEDYDERTCPDGVINLAVSENHLCEDLWIERFKKSMMTFIRERFSTPELTPENFLVTHGAAGALVLLSTLCFDVTDYVITFTPYYGGIEAELRVSGPVQLLHCPLEEQVIDGKLTAVLPIKGLERFIKEALTQGKRVRGLLVINPNNPTGTVFPVEQIKEMLQIAAKYDLHVIMDEVYALSEFHRPTRFQSVLSVEQIPNRDKVHFVWSVSKDFGLSGLSCGVIYTTNAELKSAAVILLIFSSVPPIITAVLESVINDKEWLDTVYFPTNTSRLRKAHDYTVDRLQGMNLSWMPAKAGYFIWLDLRKYLVEKSHEAEMALSAEIYNIAKVTIYPGQIFHHVEPGWFRLTFTQKPHVLALAMERLKSFVQTKTSVASTQRS